MKAYTLLTWRPGQDQFVNAGTLLSPRDALAFARQLGADEGEWREGGFGGPVAALWWQPGETASHPSFYVTETAVHAEATWTAAQAAARLLRDILAAVVRRGTERKRA